MAMNDQPGAVDWLRLAEGLDLSTVRREAADALAARGIAIETLDENDVRIDIIRGIDRRTYYRLRVRTSAIATSGDIRGR